jgi:hypothetical protein
MDVTHIITTILTPQAMTRETLWLSVGVVILFGHLTRKVSLNGFFNLLVGVVMIPYGLFVLAFSIGAGWFVREFLLNLMQLK